MGTIYNRSREGSGMKEGRRGVVIVAQRMVALGDSLLPTNCSFRLMAVTQKREDLRNAEF